LYYRDDKVLPTLFMDGFPIHEIEHIEMGSDPLGGEFTIALNDEEVTLSYDEGDWDTYALL